MRGSMTRLPLLLALLIFAAPVRAACTASAQSVAFGTYNPISATAQDSTGQVSVTCTGGLAGIGLLVSYNIHLSSGGAGNYLPRKMSAAGSLLNYNLYRDALRAVIWGNGTGGSLFVSDAYLLALGPLTRQYTVYGRIPAQQVVSAGSYADTITVTVNY